MKVFKFQQYSTQWHETRRGVPTASEFHNLITPVKGEPTKGSTSDGYIFQLIGDLYDDNYGIVDDYISATMKNGITYEPQARAWYSFDQDVKCEQVGFLMTDDGRFGCSPDSLVGNDGGLEIKCPLAKTQARYLIENILPPEYKAQVHGSLIVSGRAWWDFISYCPDAPRMPKLRIRVEPDEYTEKLREALDVFWDRYQALKSRIAAAEPIKPPVKDIVMF